MTSFVFSLDPKLCFVVCLSSLFFRVLLTCFFLGCFVFVVDFLTIAGGFFLI